MTTENTKRIIHQTEGRRLEFKEQLSANSDIAKTIVAFANDAGGDIYKIADQIVELQKIAILQYTPIVDNIIRRKERDIDEICRTLDYVLDFAGTDDGLALFKHLFIYSKSASCC